MKQKCNDNLYRVNQYLLSFVVEITSRYLSRHK